MTWSGVVGLEANRPVSCPVPWLANVEDLHGARSLAVQCLLRKRPPFFQRRQGCECGRLDLVINATGEGTFGRWLAKAASCPTLHVWIKGASFAVRTLIKQRHAKGYYRCLSKTIFRRVQKGAILSLSYNSFCWTVRSALESGVVSALQAPLETSCV